MKKDGNASINNLLVSLFNSVLDTEAKAIITKEYEDISENDMHIIEAVGIDVPKKVSEIAKSLNVTPGTMTVNIDNLEKKGYVIRTRSESDKRVVFISLTDRGKQAFFHHRDFHKKMIKSAVANLTDDERDALMRCLTKLNNFFAEWEYEKSK
ncbi:MAG: MarR family transcriptional regulator [Lachnospiraceae bacterium]|nr:MarR family transcriptional regulator [Lachnospiraceae bacterium]